MRRLAILLMAGCCVVSWGHGNSRRGQPLPSQVKAASEAQPISLRRYVADDRSRRARTRDESSRRSSRSSRRDDSGKSPQSDQSRATTSANLNPRATPIAPSGRFYADLQEQPRPQPTPARSSEDSFRSNLERPPQMVYPTGTRPALPPKIPLTAEPPQYKPYRPPPSSSQTEANTNSAELTPFRPFSEPPGDTKVDRRHRSRHSTALSKKDSLFLPSSARPPSLSPKLGDVPEVLRPGTPMSTARSSHVSQGSDPILPDLRLTYGPAQSHIEADRQNFGAVWDIDEFSRTNPTNWLPDGQEFGYRFDTPPPIRFVGGGQPLYDNRPRLKPPESPAPTPGEISQGSRPLAMPPMPPMPDDLNIAPYGPQRSPRPVAWTPWPQDQYIGPHDPQQGLRPSPPPDQPMGRRPQYWPSPQGQNRISQPSLPSDPIIGAQPAPRPQQDPVNNKPQQQPQQQQRQKLQRRPQQDQEKPHEQQQQQQKLHKKTGAAQNERKEKKSNRFGFHFKSHASKN